MTRREEGTALIAALLIVALMSAVAVELVDATRFALFRTASVQARDDAYWHALGARDYAESALTRSVEAEPEIMRPTAPWAQGPRVFPVDGGALRGQVRDANNCINLNALADDPEASPRFAALMESLEIDPTRAQAIRAQAIDWIDADSRPEPGGAEDETYTRLDPPRRAANQPFVEIEELLGLPDMTRAAFRTLRPFVCALPVQSQPPLNVNTLTEDQAVLLDAHFKGALGVRQAEDVLYRRPSSGWETVEQFWADETIARLEVRTEMEGDIALQSEWFMLDVQVELEDGGFQLDSLVALEPSGRTRRIHQRFGAVL